MAETKPRHVGAWRLVARRMTAPDGTVTWPLGKPGEAKGFLTYNDTGFMSVGFAGAPDGTPNAPTGSNCYAGPYEFDGKVMLHHLEYHSNPSQIGGTFRREVGWEGENLILASTAPDGSRGEMIWAPVK